MSIRRIWAVAIVVAAFFGLAPGAVSNNTPERTVRLLVKVREPLAGEIEAALPLATMYLVAGQSGVPQVESFLRRHSAQKLTPVYPGIVKLKKTEGLSDLEIATSIREKFAKRASRLRAEFQPPEISRTYIVEVLRGQEGRVGEILEGMKADADVEFTEEDKRVSASVTPNDPYLQSSGSWGQAYPDLWGILKIGAPAAWNINTGAGILVAVVDTGIDYNHADIAANSQAVVHVFQPDGTERPGWPVPLANPDQYSQSFLAVGDLNRDGHDEIVYSHEASLYVFKDDGTLYSSQWPLSAGPSAGFGFGSVVIGDIDGDGFPEIVTTLNTIASSSDPFFKSGGSYYDEQLLAIRRDGTTAKSWQLTGGNGYDLYVYPAPAIGDFNQDGITDIAVAYEVTGSPTGVPGIVTIVSTGAKFNAAVNDWPLIHQNGRNGNVLQSPTAYTSSTSTTVSSPANPSVFGQQVTFTAAVTALTAGASVPTGQVSFLDGSISIGSCALTNGSCSVVSATLALGTHTVSAQYGGDAHSTVSVSLPVAQVVNAADYSLGASGPQSVNAGAAAMYTITVAPNPAPFNFAVTGFACSGLPTGAGCAFSASSVTPGASSATTTLTITTTSRTLAMARADGGSRPFAFAAWGSFGIVGLVGLAGVCGGGRRKRVGYLAGLVLLVCGLAVSCGGSGGGGSGGPVPNPNGTPAGSYTVTVSAVGNGSIAQSVIVTLNVN